MGAVEETTTKYRAPEAPPSSSSTARASLPPEPTPPPEWDDRLNATFLRFHIRRLPTPKQSASAYLQVGERWEEFLVWLGSTPQIRKTQHGGGLRFLIECFEREVPIEAKPTSEAQTFDPVEDELHWRRRYQQNPAEREDIERLCPHINFKEQGTNP